MGVEPFLIAYAINIIVAQRLIRRLCDTCKRKIDKIDEAVAERAGINIEEWEGIDVYEAVGCEKCNNSGYKGRMAIHEALYFTKGIRDLIVRAGDDIDEDAVRIQSRKDGTLTLRDSGLEKVKQGQTSLAEVLAGTMDE
jgi:type IV pilus assembly protein PilB